MKLCGSHSKRDYGTRTECLTLQLLRQKSFDLRSRFCTVSSAAVYLLLLVVIDDPRPSVVTLAPLYARLSRMTEDLWMRRESKEEVQLLQLRDQKEPDD